MTRQFFEALHWRYAAKNMTGQAVPSQKVEAILEAIRLSASSTGLQPYTIVVITDPILKGKIHELACPQPQVVESSYLLVFAAQVAVTAEHIDAYMQHVAQVRHVPIESLAGFSESVKGNLLTKSAEEIKNWTARQAYIALGFGLVAAAVEKVDSSPMEGFNPVALNQLLGLNQMNLTSVALLALGYRNPEKDFLAKAKKVRKERADLFVELA